MTSTRYAPDSAKVAELISNNRRGMRRFIVVV
jgi:hypothetical protein